jgi:transcription elongation factor GreA
MTYRSCVEQWFRNRGSLPETAQIDIAMASGHFLHRDRSIITGCHPRWGALRCRADYQAADRSGGDRLSHMPEHIKKRLSEEIQALERELTHDLPKELKKAVAMGDLSENAEYHMAKQRQEFVRARLGQLKKRMGDLSLVNMNNIPRDKAALGSTIKVYDSTKDEQIEYKLVTSEESDSSKGLISTTSPIGRALMGKKVGDTATVVTPSGNREMEVLSLLTIHDEAGQE